MSGSHWTRFLKTKVEGESSDHYIDKKDPVQIVTSADDAGPGRHSFEEGYLTHSSFPVFVVVQ